MLTDEISAEIKAAYCGPKLLSDEAREVFAAYLEFGLIPDMPFDERFGSIGQKLRAAHHALAEYLRRADSIDIVFDTVVFGAADFSLDHNAPLPSRITVCWAAFGDFMRAFVNQSLEDRIIAAAIGTRMQFILACVFSMIGDHCILIGRSRLNGQGLSDLRTEMFFAAARPFYAMAERELNDALELIEMTVASLEHALANQQQGGVLGGLARAFGQGRGAPAETRARVLAPYVLSETMLRDMVAETRSRFSMTVPEMGVEV